MALLERMNEPRTSLGFAISQTVWCGVVLLALSWLVVRVQVSEDGRVDIYGEEMHERR